MGRAAWNHDPFDDALNAALPLDAIVFEIPGGCDRRYIIGVRAPSAQGGCDDVDAAPLAPGTERDL